MTVNYNPTALKPKRGELNGTFHFLVSSIWDLWAIVNWLGASEYIWMWSILHHVRSQRNTPKMDLSSYCSRIVWNLPAPKSVHNLLTADLNEKSFLKVSPQAWALSGQVISPLTAPICLPVSICIMHNRHHHQHWATTEVSNSIWHTLRCCRKVGAMEVGFSEWIYRVVFLTGPP